MLAAAAAPGWVYDRRPMWRAITAAAAALMVLTACSSGGDKPEVTQQPTEDSRAVTGADVVTAVEAAGLPVINPRDNTDANCKPDSLPCAELLTTDTFSVYVWNTPADAQQALDAAATSPPLLLGDRTTIAFQPVADRAGIEQALANLK